MSWKPISTAPEGAPILAMNRSWATAGVVMFYDGEWHDYWTDDPIRFSPPELWQPIEIPTGSEWAAVDAEQTNLRG